MDRRIETPEQMHQFGRDLAQQTKKVVMHGELGAGKTTLAKGLAAGRGYAAREVQSPTYTYIHIYDEKILHMDMRRLETEEQFLQLGIFDLIDQYEYVMIERPKWTQLYLSSERKSIEITKQNEYRIITFE